MIKKLFALSEALIVFVLAMLAICVLVLIIRDSPLWIEGEKSAAWVQAVGSIVAILVAILVSHLQNKSQEQRELKARDDEVMGMLHSVRCELEVLLESAQSNVGIHIDRLNARQGLLMTYPVPEEPFKIYYALIPKLGLIEDRSLRSDIVRTYGKAASAVASFRQNNQMVAAYEAVITGGVNELNAIQVEAARRTLAAINEYGEGLKFIYQEARESARALITRLPDAR